MTFLFLLRYGTWFLAPIHCSKNPEPVFLNFNGAQEPIPRNRFRQPMKPGGPVRQPYPYSVPRPHRIPAQHSTGNFVSPLLVSFWKSNLRYCLEGKIVTLSIW
jgi:hypothetical protein